MIANGRQVWLRLCSAAPKHRLPRGGYGLPCSAHSPRVAFGRGVLAAPAWRASIVLTKRIVALANSIKRGGWCVAGREILSGAAEPRFGAWIRPVRSQSSGELSPQHCEVSREVPVVPLDIVDIPLLGPANDAGQPENWRIDERRRWSKTGAFPLRDVHFLTDSPLDLWRHHGERVDRIPVAAQAARQPQLSITLIQPQRLTFRLWRKYDKFKDHERLRTDAEFEYRDQRYLLNVTDPRLETRHHWQHPPRDAEPLEIRLPGGDNCRLCVSLTPPFEGYHYKVVACVLELP